MTGHRREVSYSWKEVHEAARELSRSVPQVKWKGIIAISRGGLFPASIVSRELGIRLVETVCIATYNDQDMQEEETVLKGLEGDSWAGWLILDDLVDSGKTAQVVKEMLPEAHLGVLYAKPDGRPYADTFVVEVPQDIWIVFPWETETSDTSISPS
jgi:xanthine phosphoribosyltransferase